MRKLKMSYCHHFWGKKLQRKKNLLYSLPARMGGLGIFKFSEKCKHGYDASKKVSKPLTNLIIQQSEKLPSLTEILELRAEVPKSKSNRLNNLLNEVENTLMPEQNRAVQQVKQKGTSNWLNVLPLEDHGFTLTKGDFRDALALHYNKPLRSLPSNCPCGQKLNVTHALNCKKGGFVTIRHNNIYDFEANLLRIVHNDVEVEPQLQQVDNEQFNGLKEDNARPDIRAKGV